MSEAPKPRILIVDDEEAILETMAFTFEDDYDVFTATDPERGLELLEQHAPVAAVISDQRMPKTSGVEFLAEVYARYPATTRIMLTGFADMEATIKAINDGHVYAYVTKPWEPDDLKQLVRRAVDFHSLRLENERLVNDLRGANVFLEAVMNQLDTGALALDSLGVVRAANRAALAYLGLEKDPRGKSLPDVFGNEPLGPVANAVERLGSNGVGSYEDLDLRHGACTLRLRVSLKSLTDSGDEEIGRVILLREISHEPLRREFEEIVGSIAEADEGLRGRLVDTRPALRALSERAREASVRSPGMAELAEQTARTLTAIEHWLDVDEALASEDYPDARLLIDRMRVAMARWPLADQVPKRVGELAARVEAYYESGENPKQHVL